MRGVRTHRELPDTAADLKLAKTATLPAKLEPQLATLVSAVPPGDWVLETKFDGYRMLARVDSGQIRLFTRNGHDWTSKLKPIATALADLGINSGWLDCEIVVLNDAGLPDFNGLQNAIDNARTKDIKIFVFDAPFLNCKDLRAVPLVTRRALLEELLRDCAGQTVRFSQAFDAPPTRLLGAACQMGLEGVM